MVSVVGDELLMPVRVANSVGELSAASCSACRTPCRTHLYSSAQKFEVGSCQRQVVHVQLR